MSSDRLGALTSWAVCSSPPRMAFDRACAPEYDPARICAEIANRIRHASEDSRHRCWSTFVPRGRPEQLVVPPDTVTILTAIDMRQSSTPMDSDYHSWRIIEMTGPAKRRQRMLAAVHRRKCAS